MCVCVYNRERETKRKEKKSKLLSLPVEMIPVHKAPDSLGNNRIISPNERKLPEYQVRKTRRILLSAQIVAAHAFLYVKVAPHQFAGWYVVASVAKTKKDPYRAEHHSNRRASVQNMTCTHTYPYMRYPIIARNAPNKCVECSP